MNGASESPATADICDVHGDGVQVLAPGFGSFGARQRCSGPVTTLKLHEDNSLVRDALAEDGAGRVLIVDGGGSRRCALLGGNMAALAAANGWTGVLVNGCVRDRNELSRVDLVVIALASHPRRSENRGEGQRDIDVYIAGSWITPGDYVYIDADGIAFSAEPLSVAE